MIGASSASIPWAYCGYLALNLRIAQACSLCADFGISFAFPRIKMYQSCVQSSSYSSIRSAMRATPGCFVNVPVVRVEHASVFGLRLCRKACRHKQNKSVRCVADSCHPASQASQLWPSLIFSEPHRMHHHATNGAYLSSTPRISSRVKSGIARSARWIPTSRYSARTASSAGAPNTLIESVEKSLPAADAA